MVGPLRIASVAACPIPSRRGTPLRVQRLAEALIDRGHTVDVVTYRLHGPVEPTRFPCHRPQAFGIDSRLPPGPDARKVLLDPMLTVELARLLRRRRFDVVHAHHYEGLLVALAARGRLAIPIVYDAHTVLASELPTYGLGVGKRLSRAVGDWLDRVLPTRADRIVTVTDDIRDRMIERHGLDPARIDTIMNGVELDCFPGDAPVGDPDLLFYSGTTADYQRLDLLIDAFARARSRRPQLRLRLALNGAADSVRALAAGHGVEAALEIVADDFTLLPSRLAEAAVALLPRTACDGIPQKLLNYMAAGRPAIASAGSAKVLAHGREGLVVANDDVDGFASAILALTGQPELARRMGRAARARVEANGTWQHAAHCLERVFAAASAGTAASAVAQRARLDTLKPVSASRLLGSGGAVLEHGRQLDQP